MEELLSSAKPVTFSRGQEVKGQVISKTDHEVTLDLGGKSDGVMSSRDFPGETFAKLKIGDTVTAYVVGENDSNQIQLSMSYTKTAPSRFRGGISWNKFIQAKDQKTPLNGKVTEVNKGGLMLEVTGVRGFLPSSLIGFDLIRQVTSGGLVGKETVVLVSEIESQNNRLIFTQKDLSGESVREVLSKFSTLSEINGKILSLLPFALVVEMADGVNAVVFNNEASWESRDLGTLFKIGAEIKAKVISVDKELGRVNLSIKQLQKNPFDEVAEKFQPDDVIKATVTEVTDQGISFELTDGIMGFMDSSKKERGIGYEVGQSMQVLVDSVDKRKQRVNLTPFITTTKGLIYK